MEEHTIDNSDDCWISPSGEIIWCGYMQHRYVADEIVPKMYPDESTFCNDNFLKEKGWIWISSYDRFRWGQILLPISEIPHFRLTQSQIEAIKQIFEHGKTLEFLDEMFSLSNYEMLFDKNYFQVI